MNAPLPKRRWLRCLGVLALAAAPAACDSGNATCSTYCDLIVCETGDDCAQLDVLDEQCPKKCDESYDRLQAREQAAIDECITCFGRGWSGACDEPPPYLDSCEAACDSDAVNSAGQKLVGGFSQFIENTCEP